MSYNKNDRIKFNNKMKFKTGSGGSKNLIYISNKYVFKIVPFEKKRSFEKIRKNKDQIEINNYKILTNEFILKNKTPHIVRYYDKYKMNITKIFNNCPTIKDILTKKKAFDNKNKTVCNLKKLYQNKLIKQVADVIVLEKCPDTIQDYLGKLIKSNKRNKYKLIAENIDIISFQVIFTLAIIQKKFPSFVHNDFFLRNIMGNIIKDKSNKYNKYNKYQFKNKTFYLPVNGLSIKINDFGDILCKPNMISSGILFKSREKNIPRINCKKCDIFNFFHDFYYGQDKGAKCITTLMKRKSKKNKNYIKSIFKKYIDIKLIDKINKINKNIFDRTWFIGDIQFLKKIVKTPEEYLNSHIFDKYRKLPKNGIIINSYNK